jgi:3-methyladenine DNA glycosylase AlkD
MALNELRALGEQRNIDGMARFGIRAKIVYGVAKPKMDLLARRLPRESAGSLRVPRDGLLRTRCVN